MWSPEELCSFGRILKDSVLSNSTDFEVVAAIVEDAGVVVVFHEGPFAADDGSCEVVTATAVGFLVSAAKDYHRLTGDDDRPLSAEEEAIDFCIPP